MTNKIALYNKGFRSTRSFTRWVNATIDPGGTRLMRILPRTIAHGKQNLTSRAGLTLVAHLIERLGLTELAGRLLPKPGSNRGYGAGEVFATLMLMLHEGGRCLEDVSDLEKERPLLGLLGFARLPTAKTLGNWLHRVGGVSRSMCALKILNRRVVSAALCGCRRVTLDIDATVIDSAKRDAKYSYKKTKGYTPMVGHIVEAGQVAAVDFREGNESPNSRNLEFIRECEQSLPPDVSVKAVRIDAAGYSGGVINYLMSRGMRFAVRARMDSSVRTTIGGIGADQWRPLVRRDGTESRREEVAVTLHVMHDTPEAFTLVVQRQRIDDGEQAHLDLMVADADGESVTSGIYVYRAIATSMYKQSASEVVHWYNQRAEHSENRLKELRSDFAGDRLPCGDFDANAAWLLINAIAYNLLALMRMVLPTEFACARAKTVRRRLYDIGGRVVRHSRRWVLKVSTGNCRALNEALLQIRGFPLRN